MSNGELHEQITDIARRMGAITLEPPKIATKTAALQLGIEQSVGEDGHHDVLLVDADSLVIHSLWPHAMQRSMDLADHDIPVVLTGPIAFDRGGKKQQPFLNSYRTLRMSVLDLNLVMSGEPPMAHGANMGLRFDPDGELYQNWQKIDPTLSMRVDTAIRDLTLHSHGTALATWDPRTLVITPGDRFSTWQEFRGNECDQAARANRYSESYGAIHGYDGTNLFAPKSSDLATEFL